ncbi:MAG: carboxypeptidase regulatory-like domain-containing protein, partial [Polyangiaceae bacterium]|nr:carboxypeptidase regulatory-like domain-containing protein [Polyangiaceae bacterium]
MICRRLAPSLIVLALAANTAIAQPPPPRGPAEVITRAREAREARETAEATAVPDEAPSAGVDPDADAMQAHAARALSEPLVASTQPSADVPVGEIWVSVLDVTGEPARGAPVRLGVMGSAGARENKTTETDAQGQARFTALPTGAGQAYRVNVLHEGATYSSTPFRLELDQGHVVRVLRIPVTRDPQAILQWVGGTFLEIKPERRVHVIQQAELVNLGRETYV